MDNIDVVEERELLETTIKWLLLEFQSRTGLMITSVSILSEARLVDFCQTYDIKIQVSL